jgi:hypothetical protein
VIEVRQFPRWTATAALLLALAGGHASAHAQASAIPSASPIVGKDTAAYGHKLIDQMVEALGGDAWRSRRNWKSNGFYGIFYKSKPNDVSPKFEEYHLLQPDTTRFVVITHYGGGLADLLGAPIGISAGKDHKDIVQILTPDNSYEITYKGKEEMPKDIATEQLRQRAHTLDVVMTWLKKPGTEVFYEGMGMVARRPAERVSITNADNDSVTLELDASTHLPVSREFRYRDPKFNDFDLDREEYDNYQRREGVMTPFTITRYRNGDMVAQRFIIDLHYNQDLAADLFNPEIPLSSKPPKK